MSCCGPEQRWMRSVVVARRLFSSLQAMGKRALWRRCSGVPALSTFCHRGASCDERLAGPGRLWTCQPRTGLRRSQQPPPATMHRRSAFWGPVVPTPTGRTSAAGRRSRLPWPNQLCRPHWSPLSRRWQTVGPA